MKSANATTFQAPGAARIPYVDLALQGAQEEKALVEIFRSCLRSGQWVGGQAIESLQNELRARFESPHAIAVASGTDALILGMRALNIGPGDEVITPPNSFVSSTSAIIAVGATPVFVDVGPDQLMDVNKLATKITPRTKAIMPVHLSGRCVDMPTLNTVAREHDLAVIEDAAQAIGAKWSDRFAGTMGDVGCFSAHPLKNLNAMGDAGFVFCKTPEVANRLLQLRNNGHVDRNRVVEWSSVSRMDPLQAGILSHRLKRLDEVHSQRRKNAARYQQLLERSPVKMTHCRPEQFTVFHTFVIQVERRNALQAYLAECGIASSIHYPTPIHLQPAAKDLGYAKGDFPVAEAQADRILSLPVHQFLTSSQISFVCERIDRFFS